MCLYRFSVINKITAAKYSYMESEAVSSSIKKNGMPHTLWLNTHFMCQEPCVRNLTCHAAFFLCVASVWKLTFYNSVSKYCQSRKAQEHVITLFLVCLTAISISDSCRLFQLNLGAAQKSHELEADTWKYWKRLRKENIWRFNRLHKGKKF